jgi:hypothetical protein
MRILCKFLPPCYNHLQKFLTPIDYSLIKNEQETIQLNNQRYTIVQETKRQWLHISLSIYEKKLQDYDQQYKETLNHLESILRNDNRIHFTSVCNSIHRYMTYRTNHFKQEILNKMVSYREKLIQHRRRSSSTKLVIGVSPEPYLDLSFNPFDRLEWNYLSLGKDIIYHQRNHFFILSHNSGPSYISLGRCNAMTFPAQFYYIFSVIRLYSKFLFPLEDGPLPSPKPLKI